MILEYFADIIEFLPSEVTDNLYFKQIITALENDLKGKVADNNISINVNREMFIKITTIYPELSNALTLTNNPNNILYLLFLTNEGLISLKLEKTNDEYNLVTNVINYGNTKKIKLSIGKTKMRLEIIEDVERNQVLVSYKHNIKYYDLNYNQLNIDTEKEVDEIFAEKFGIPLNKARYYRLNFKDNIDYLNKSMIISFTRYLELHFDDMVFHGPLNINDLEKYIYYLCDREVGIKHNKIEDYTNTNKLQETINNLKAYIGDSEEIIISDNLYQNLSFYLMGFTNNILYISGKIIKKLNGIYYLYYIHIENNQVLGMTGKLSENNIDAIIDKNLTSNDLENISTFFGKGRII